MSIPYIPAGEPDVIERTRRPPPPTDGDTGVQIREFPPLSRAIGGFILLLCIVAAACVVVGVWLFTGAAGAFIAAGLFLFAFALILVLGLKGQNDA